MSEIQWLDEESSVTFQRLLPRLQQRYQGLGEDVSVQEWHSFVHRLETHFKSVFRLLVNLYGQRYDFFYHLEEIISLAMEMGHRRPKELKELDTERETNPTWFQSNEMVGGMCYVDLFAEDLRNLKEKIPYFKKLGLNYLHLMPLFLCPEGESDGGYAVSSYRDVNPKLGTMEELADLAKELRKNNISLVIDFIFNHTSDEHEWAQKALAGDPEYKKYYWIFEDKELIDQYQQYVRDIFPERGKSYTYRPEIKSWVWTTFYSVQWDLNYSNPEVFRRMLGEMLFLANIGVEVLRMDAVAFIWKMLGTDCENRPEAHMILQAYNSLLRIAAPAVLFKSEAIVHPDEVARYISPNECQLSYHPLLMALLWNSLATREVKLLQLSMRNRFQIHPDCVWVNYVRCHDDIGWTFDDAEAWSLGINGHDHRQFLNSFFSGRFPGSFARGVPFQENPQTGDARISGTLASLCGLEKALQQEDEGEKELSIQRILLVHSVILSIGGIPLLYLGDEVAMLNDYSYVNDPAKANDTRWVNRPAKDWKKDTDITETSDTPQGRVFDQICHLIQLRKQYPVFASSQMEIVNTGNDHIFSYLRRNSGQQLVVVANFTERPQTVNANEVRLHGGYRFTDIISDQTITLDQDLVLEPYQFRWMLKQN